MFVSVESYKMWYILWLDAFMQYSVFKAHPRHCVYQDFVLGRFCCNTLLHFVYPFIIWWTFGLFLLFGFYEYCCCEHMGAKLLCEHLFSSSLGSSLEVELLDQMVTVHLPFWGHYQTFSKVTVLLYSLTRNIVGLFCLILEAGHWKTSLC